jgi:hypothetical protein
VRENLFHRPMTPSDRYQDNIYVNTGVHGARENLWLPLRFSDIKDAVLIRARVELTANG